MYTVKQLTGFSGARIELIQPDTGSAFVRKWCDPTRNIERLSALGNLGIRTPRILRVEADHYDQEYIQGLDAASYLTQYSAGGLTSALGDLLDLLSSTAGSVVDYTSAYRERLAFISGAEWRDQLPFSSEELISRLPPQLPASCYYGDLTLENCLWDVRSGAWVWIDAQRIEYSSWAFDLAKLRQDITCGWFLRARSPGVCHALAGRIQSIESALRERYGHYWHDSLLILMLLRVIKYTGPGTRERLFILEWIRRLWT